MIRLGLIGYPIQHSLSPWIHQQFAQQFNLEVEYSLYEISTANQVLPTIQQLFNEGLRGLNITIPYKQHVLRCVDELFPRAAAAQSVNTLLWKDGRIYGDNTDGLGLVRDITHNLQFTLQDKKILLLGAGGAARGVVQSLLLKNPKQIVVVNRTEINAEALVQQFKRYGNLVTQSYESLAHQCFDIVIDSTGDEADHNLPASLTLSENSLCYDLKYRLKNTFIMEWGVQHKAEHVHNGWGMLVEQAALAFALWTDRQPNTHSAIEEGNRRFYSK